MGCLGGPLSRLWSLPGPAGSGTAGVKGGISETASLSGWWLATPRWFICSVWIWGTWCSTTAGDLGKGASLNLRPSVNGVIDDVVARASHLNWAEL